MPPANIIAVVTGVLLLAAGSARGETPPTPAFEAATVRPAQSSDPGHRIQGGPGTQDPGRFTATNIPLNVLLWEAFDVWPDQISGPAWIDGKTYSIVASLPRNTSKDEFQVMFQNVLLERFNITMHRVKKSFPGYEMTVANGPFQLTPSSVDLSARKPLDLDNSRPLKTDKDGFPILPEGNFKLQSTAHAEGQDKQTWRGWSIADIATLVENRTHLRVVDKTGLKGIYDFRVRFRRPPAAGPAGEAAAEPFDPVQDTVNAVQQLGLKLERTTVLLDVIVIDSVAKTPIEN